MPGNHDILDARSARIWRELLGETYYAFDYGAARFIVLDTRTEEARVGRRQFEWRRAQLVSAGPRLRLRRAVPLYPLSGHIGSSLDAHPVEREPLARTLRQSSRGP